MKLQKALKMGGGAKLALACFCVALGAFVAHALDNAAITVTSVSQRWPMSRLVDVTYSLAGATGPVDVDVTLTANGKTEAVPDAAISGTARSVTNGGPYRLTFDPTRTAFANEDMLSECTVTLTPAAEKLYMLVDIASSLGNSAARVTYTNAVIGTGMQWDDLYKTNYIVLRRIPAGTFMMGRSATPGSGYGHEAPQHRVTLTKDFYMAVYETTFAQFKKVGGTYPIKNTDSYFTDQDPLRPVHCVRYYTIRNQSTWSSTNELSAARDCGGDSYWLGKLRKLTGGGYLFDFPTEAQWEYACHAGTSGDYYTGEDLTSFVEGADPKLATLARYRYNGGYLNNGTTAPDMSCTADEGGLARVGSYSPNDWGLYDMLGNVEEWCLDYYTGGTLGSDPSVDPRGGAYNMNAGQAVRMLRGGSWLSNMKACRTTYRTANNSGVAANSVGFRLCLTLE